MRIELLFSVMFNDQCEDSPQATAVFFYSFALRVGFGFPYFTFNLNFRLLLL